MIEHQALAVQPWGGSVEPLERDIEDRMRGEGLDPYRWSNAPNELYSPHTHPYHKVLFVVRGSLSLTFTGTGRRLEMHTGDRLDLPPGVAHEAHVCPGGVTCLEAHVL